MTCKDCIHYEVCCDEYELAHAENCNNFKDKSKYIELPCKVGDRIYRPVIDYIREETVMLIIQRIFKDELVVTLHTDYSTYDLKEIGDLYFFTKSEAEQKLKELKENA